MDAVGPDNLARVGCPPKNLIVPVKPREDALSVRTDQRSGRQIATDRQETIGLSQCPRRGWKGLVQSQAGLSPSRNFSASSAAMQPNPAEVIACR